MLPTYFEKMNKEDLIKYRDICESVLNDTFWKSVFILSSRTKATLHNYSDALNSLINKIEGEQNE